MYIATITVDDNGELLKLFEPEDKNLGRSSYKINSKGKKITFDIQADDATALKVALSTINKILIVNEKTGQLVK